MVSIVGALMESADSGLECAKVSGNTSQFEGIEFPQFQARASGVMPTQVLQETVRNICTTKTDEIRFQPQQYSVELVTWPTLFSFFLSIHLYTASCI